MGNWDLQLIHILFLIMNFEKITWRNFILFYLVYWYIIIQPFFCFVFLFSKNKRDQIKTKVYGSQTKISNLAICNLSDILVHKRLNEINMG